MNYPVYFGGRAVFKELQHDLILLKRSLIVAGIALILTEFVCLYIKTRRLKKDNLGTSKFASKSDIIDSLYDDEDGD